MWQGSPVPRLTVSTCIPTHGRIPFLLEALESGLAQTRAPDEIVVSDDLGSEETRTLVTAFAPRAPFPVRYVHCTTGQSLADNINNCFREAHSDLVLLLHDDDLLVPCSVQALAAPFEENPKLVGSYGKQMFISDAGEELLPYTEQMNHDFRRDSNYAGLQPDAVLAGIWQQFPNDGYMVKTAIAREVGHTREFRSASEFDFGIRMGERGEFYYVDEYTAKYRESNESIGRSAGGKNDDSAYHGMRILSRALKTNPQYETELVKVMKDLSPMSIRMGANTGHLDEAIGWYFGPYHRHRILSPGGLKTGLLLGKTWLRAKLRR